MKEKTHPSTGELVRSVDEHTSGRLMLLTLGGSHAYGFENEESDWDRLGVWVADLKDLITIPGIGRETVDYKDEYGDVTLHELGKTCRLALKGNPTVLATLFGKVILTTEDGMKLKELAPAFLHRKTLNAFHGYAKSQLRKYEENKGVHTQGSRATGKWAAHLMRILWQGLDLAKTGTMTMSFSGSRLETLQLLRGKEDGDREFVLQEGRRLLRHLEGFMDGAGKPALPEEPDLQAINEFMMDVRLK